MIKTLNKGKKEKGFTLIELLAVIIILAVLALIAVPQVIQIIEKSKKSAFEDSVYGITSSTENYVADLLLKNNGMTPNEILEFSCNDEGCEIQNELTGYIKNSNLNFKGKKMKSGKIYLETNGNITVSYLTDGNYCAHGEIENLIIEKDCASIDDTKPIIDPSKLEKNSKSNSIIIKLNEGFAIDEESGIKNYIITIKNSSETFTKTVEEIGEYEFTGLKENEEYEIVITVTNNKELTSYIYDEIATGELGTVIGTTDNSSYAQSKIGYISFSGEGVYLIKPSVDVTANEEVVTCASSIDAEYDCEGSTVSVGGKLTGGQ